VAVPFVSRDTLSGALSLADALRAAMSTNPSLRIAREQVRIDRGSVTLARSAFDVALRSSLGSGRSDGLGFAPPATSESGTGIAALRSQTTEYAISAEKQFDRGLILIPSLSLTRLVQPSHSALAVNRAQANVTAIVPLGRNRGGGVVAVQQRSAEHALAASGFDQRQTLARVMMDVAISYWEYAATIEQLGALRYAESRAQTLVNETTELVAGDARPKSDLIQFRGTLASRRTQRIGAEQSVAEARQRLGIVLGLDPLAVLTLPPARMALVAGESPDATVTGPRDTVASVLDPDIRGRDWARQVVLEVLRVRPDLHAARARREASDAQLNAARNGLRAGVDLRVGAGVSGLDQGLALTAAAAPLLRNPRGMSVSIQLDYALPLLNLSARGALEQAEAGAAQARTIERDRVRQVEVALAVAAAGLFRSREALGNAALALQMAREVVENEKQKFRLGVSTQIDVVFAEDALTNALVNDIATRAAYATAVAALRLESGALAAVGEDPVALASLFRSDNELWRIP